jgi:hypothetical protein
MIRPTSPARVAADARLAQVVQAEQRVGLAPLLEREGLSPQRPRSGPTTHPGNQDAHQHQPIHRPSLGIPRGAP